MLLSFDILNKDQEVFGNNFLEASAGTGKTFTIEHLVVRLLLESPSLLTLQEILVVTFTKAATSELKKRLRKTIADTLQHLTEKKGPPYLEKFLCSESSIKEAQRRLQEALSSFDNASVFTIHGFCFRMLQECALEMNLPLELQDPEENDIGRLCEKSIAETFRFYLPEGQFGAKQLRLLLNECMGDLEALTSKIKRLIMEEGEIAPFPSFTENFERFLQIKPLFANLNIDFDALIEAHKLEKLTKQEALNQKERLLTFFQKKEPTLKDFENLLDKKIHFLEFLIETNLKARAKISWNEDALQPLRLLQKHFLPLYLEITNPTILLLRLSSFCKIRFENFLQEREIFSFSSLLKKTNQAIQDPICQKKIASYFKCVIIDEFQDTDPIQWSIFKTLFFNKTESFYLVGDPKQSIYGFRSADIYTYRQASQAFGEKNSYFLDTCFRSQSSLIEALNAFFSTCDWMRLPLTNELLPYHPVKSYHLDEKPYKALHLLILEGDVVRGKLPSDELENAQLFPFILQEIRSRNQIHNTPLEECAILVKDRFQGARVQQFLKDHGMCAIIKRSTSLIDSAAFQMLKDLFNALSHPRNLRILKKFLSSSFFTYPLEELKGNLENPLIAFTMQKMGKLKSLFEKEGLAITLEHLLETTWHQNKVSILTHIAMQDSETLSAWQELLQILFTQNNQNRFTLESLSPFLSDLEHGSSDSDLLKATQASPEDAVTILTTHMSKGLEYEVVFAIGVSTRTKRLDSIVRYGKERMAYPFDETNPACLLAQEEIESEKLRQLYVALTRGKSHVYLPLIFDSKEKEIPLGTSSATELFLSYCKIKNLTYSNIEPLLLSLEKNYPIELIALKDLKLEPLVNTHQIEPLSCKEIPSPVPFIEHITSFSALQKNSVPLEIRTSRTAAPDEIPSSAEFGNLFHELMEEIIQRSLYFPYDEITIKLLIFNKTLKTPYESFVNKIETMVQKVFHMRLQSSYEIFSLIDIPPSQFQVEMEFLFPEKDFFVKGFIDVIFQYKNRYYILDWKTNYLGDSEEDYLPQLLHEEMLHHDYYRQASLYASALCRYLNTFQANLFETSFDGCFYVFVRGPNALHFTPIKELTEKEVF